MSEAILYAPELGSGANVIILTDSQYVITVAQSAKPVELNADLVGEIRRRLAIAALWDITVTLKWIKGHSGILGNVLADRCACQARDGLAARLALKKPPG